ncbi:TIGR04282 family arsenosugar biosynthesis glycosyltransferase (plasmid) [Coraliomargarita sp. W4R53]
MTALVVIAKECVPGRVKTRLHPPYTLEQAAAIAAASLADTLAVARRAPADRHILYFDGDASETPHEGFEVVAQAGGSLDERLAALFDLLDEPTLLIGMDTPQVTTADLRWPQHTDVVFGPANDGGFWALGMREPRGDVIRGVPMSRDDTGALQVKALDTAGLSIEYLVTLRDVDLAEDAQAVASQIAGSQFASAVGAPVRSAS